MKKLVDFSMAVKSFAAMIFAGFMCLYMVAGFLYVIITENPFEYSIPFAFAIQGAILSMLISCLWGVFFSGVIIKKWRYFARMIMFSFSIMILLAVCFLTVSAIPAEWTNLWLIAVGGVGAFVVILAVISEIYFKATGERYTKILQSYKENILK